MVHNSNKWLINKLFSEIPRNILGSVFILFFLAACSTEADRSVYTFPDDRWEVIENPADAGWSEEGLDLVSQMTDTLDTAALMIVHNGRVIYSDGDLDFKFRCHSLRKSFLSSLYGIQVAEGVIDLDSTVGELGIDDNEGISDIEKQATVQMLLQARSGVYHPALFETASMAAARPERHSHEPGTHYYYNNWDFNVLGTIYEQETGEAIHESFGRRIALPIGMQDYTPEDGRYVTGEASRHAAYPFVMSTRDLARFGLLYLNDGIWNGERVLPEGWVEESTTSYSDAEDNGGYGYLWWISVDGQHFNDVEGVPEGTYTGRGAGGHVLAVVPEHDLVVVHRVSTHESGNRVSYGDFGKVLMAILNAHGA